MTVPQQFMSPIAAQLICLQAQSFVSLCIFRLRRWQNHRVRSRRLNAVRAQLVTHHTLPPPIPQ